LQRENVRSLKATNVTYFPIFRYLSGTATNGSVFGEVPEDFIFGKVDCDGSEKTILDCSGSCTNNCGSQNGAGVICQGIAQIEMKQKGLILV
jgi:hypothetical protein